MSIAIHAKHRKPALEKWRDIYKELYPNSICPSPLCLPFESYVAETSRPSPAFKSLAIKKIIAGDVLPPGLDSELFFDLACEMTPFIAAAFSETVEGWDLQNAAELSAPSRAPSTRSLSTGHGEQQELTANNYGDLENVNGLGDDVDMMFNA